MPQANQIQRIRQPSSRFWSSRPTQGAGLGASLSVAGSGNPRRPSEAQSAGVQSPTVRDIQAVAGLLFEPADIVELRAIGARCRRMRIVKRWTPAADLPAMADELAALNRQGFGIYFGVNPRRQSGCSGDSNVRLARCLFADMDDVEPGDGCGRFEFVYTDLMAAGLPEPTLAVHSGHGIHLYWRLDEPLDDLVLWQRIQSQLNERLGADKAIKNPERLMRLPGFWNTKRQPYQDCFICWGVSYANGKIV
ncbi:MAG TPA: DNA-primase RepB domain-containing protein [Anaerohalosphaeraceae bacterium]|nr:hypothetical protein [Phycisphaerae bacterium]HOK95197.1 DNA-primase RepB domain-containing protein [Anaerohalosphaeraceae bacterium]HOL31965.1 DNA-primase RepB domain-containing protein [Anaerohalosphaeraceae bacterium]HOM77485.1 DNA-primase RepB domain-containing protein [Anaerohalosphaeraceae bacterium]HPC63086.1 DNA-primase RepB domain-containing protein [Anaerohalosphaeraceae bacterium]